MHKPALLLFMAVLVGCDSRKLGVAGATCSASSDCAGELQCIASTCVDLAAATRAQTAREADLRAAQELRDSEQKRQMDALMAELRALKDEQDRLENEKKGLDDRLQRVTDEAERQRLLAEKAALDAQLAENSKTQRTNRGRTGKGGVTVKKNVDDPLEGL